MTVMDVLKNKEAVIGLISSEIWAMVGDDNSMLGRIQSMGVEAGVVRGATVPMITVTGTRGVAEFNWDHVAAIIFALPEPEEEEVVLVNGGEDER